jgi:hypothetical protein
VFSDAKLAQWVVINTQAGAAASATTLFTSNYALKILPLSSTQLPAPGNNTGGIVSGSSCDAVALDAKIILERQDMIAQALATASGSILAETAQILQNQIGTNERLAVTSEKVDSNGNLLLNVQNNIETEKAFLNVILDVLDGGNIGKKEPKKGKGGTTRGKTIDHDY